MRKLTLAVIGLYVGILSAFSQHGIDTAAYKNKNLKISEINFVTAYYHQEGDHSPVTGGIGTEKLSDYATTIELKLNKYDKHDLKHDFNFELGVDYYSSASSDKIDPTTISSASWIVTNEMKGNALGVYGSFSVESDYISKGLGVGFTKTSKNKNTEFGIKLQSYLDKVKLVLPIELRTVFYKNLGDYPHASRNSYSSSLTLSQVINSRLQMTLLLDLVYQQGYLGTPFHRIYFNNNALTNEKLPSSRFKIPVGVRLNYFLGDKFIIRTYYRYYHDDWGLTANTFNIETPVKITSFISVSPFYRYYNQSAVKYYAPYMAHDPADVFYTTDDDLSKFSSNFAGVGLRLSPPGGIFGFSHLNMLELRYGHYKRTDGLHSDIITLNLKFK